MLVYYRTSEEILATAGFDLNILLFNTVSHHFRYFFLHLNLFEIKMTSKISDKALCHKRSFFLGGT